MNFKIGFNTMKSMLFATLLLATFLFTVPAHANASFRGKFTLQQETTWANLVLPPGNYVVNLDSGTGGGPCIASIQDAATGKSVGVLQSRISDTGTNRGNSLLTLRHGSHWVVQSFSVPEMGMVFFYDRDPATRLGVEEAKATETIPVLKANK